MYSEIVVTVVVSSECEWKRNRNDLLIKVHNSIEETPKIKRYI